MRAKYHSFIFALSLLTAAGCMNSVNTSMGDKAISGHSGIFSFAMLHATPKGLLITLGGKTVTVTATEITWNDGGDLKLPATWSKLELDESFGSINVNVDNQHFAKIKPED